MQSPPQGPVPAEFPAYHGDSPPLALDFCRPCALSASAGADEWQARPFAGNAPPAAGSPVAHDLVLSQWHRPPVGGRRRRVASRPVSSPRLRLSLCWWGEEWQDEGLVKRASAADFVNVGGLLTEGEVSRDGRGRTVEEAVPEGAARSAEADSTVRPRPKFFPPSSDLGLTRPSPFPRGTRRASCSRAFRAACGCCISRSRASPPQSPRPSCGSSSRGNIRP